jgi:hypothetical protein
LCSNTRKRWSTLSACWRWFIVIEDGLLYYILPSPFSFSKNKCCYFNG